LRSVVHGHFVVRADIQHRTAVVRRAVNTVGADIAATDNAAPRVLRTFEIECVEGEQHIAREIAIDGARRTPRRECGERVRDAHRRNDRHDTEGRDKATARASNARSADGAH
jgi:hypothetical protein